MFLQKKKKKTKYFFTVYHLVMLYYLDLVQQYLPYNGADFLLNYHFVFSGIMKSFQSQKTFHYVSMPYTECEMQCTCPVFE